MVEEMKAERRMRLQALRREGMRWVVLLALKCDLTNKKAVLPLSINEEIRLAKTMLASGCFSPCDISCSLNKIESKLIQAAANFNGGFENFDHWLFLLKKAMQGNLTRQEVNHLPFVQPVVQECEFLKCLCDDQET